MLSREKQFLQTMIILLILAICILLFYKPPQNQYMQSSNKIFVIVCDSNFKCPDINTCEFEFVSNYSCLDPDIWNHIAKCIFTKYNLYDAFIIIHPLDTITYLSSAITFMLENLSKTVICSNKLERALQFVKNYSIPEVVICDDQFIYRSCRTKRIKNQFVSNHEKIGKFEDENVVILNNENVLNFPKDNFSILNITSDNKVIVIKMYPGIDKKFIQKAFDEKVKAVILECEQDMKYNLELLYYIEDLVKAGIIVVSNSQSMSTNTISNMDKQSSTLESVGAISCNITTESLLGKLYVILSNIPTKSIQLLKDLIFVNMRGEL
jgi:L-asparaginase